jgi:hypothetical protein
MRNEYVRLVEETLNFSYNFASKKDMETYHQAILDPKKRELEQKAKFNNDEKAWQQFFDMLDINGKFTMGDDVGKEEAPADEEGGEDDSEL